ARSSAFVPRWDRSAIALTTLWPRASSRAWNASYWTDITSRLKLKRKPQCSSTSKGSTIRIACTHRSDTFPQSVLNGGTTHTVRHIETANRPRKRGKPNPLERLNAEIKRRTNVVGIFPNEAAITRLVGALLLEQNDEWQLQRRYLSLEGLQALADNQPARLSEPHRLSRRLHTLRGWSHGNNIETIFSRS